MIFKFPVFFFIAILLSSCTGNKKPQNEEAVIIQLLKNELASGQSHLCLLITEGMCTECIIQEYMIIKNQGNDVPIVLIGLFSNKRIFLASTEMIPATQRIFVNAQHLQIKFSEQPMYFIYDNTLQEISNIFYPESCNEESTLNYFQKIKKSLH